MTKQQKQWADYVISGKTRVDAYLAVFPNAKKKTAQNRVVLFGKVEGIEGYISKGLSRIADKVEAKVVEKLSDIEVSSVLTSAKKREILSLIASGELEQEKMVLVKDPESGKMVWRKILIKPDLHDRMKAIDLDNKMTGELFRGKANDPENKDNDNNQEIFNNVTFVFKSKEK
ncbi:MAG: hypothetical protein WAT27_07790 [Chitinophagales bacterium]